MKKILAIALILILALSLLTACGEDSGNDFDDNGNGGDINEGKVALLNDKKNVFVVINGKTYNLYDKYTVQDLVNDGFEFEEAYDLTKKEEEGYSIVKNLVFVTDFDYKDGLGTYKATFFKAKADTPIEEEYWLKDCVINEFIIPNNMLVSTVGGLTSGCTKEDVLKVFGEPTTKNEIMLFYNNDALRRTQRILFLFLF